MMGRQIGHANRQEEDCHSNESQGCTGEGQESGSSSVSETQDASHATADETPEDQPENGSGNCPSNESQGVSGENQELGSSSVSETPAALPATANETREGQPETVGQQAQECNKGALVRVDHTNSPLHPSQNTGKINEILSLHKQDDAQNNMLRPDNCSSNESQGITGRDQELGSSSVSEPPDAAPATGDETLEDQTENSTPTRKRKHSSGDEYSASTKRNPTKNSNLHSNDNDNNSCYMDSTTPSLPRQGNANIPRNPTLDERAQRQEGHDVHQNQAGQENNENNLVLNILGIFDDEPAENMPDFFITETGEILFISNSDDSDFCNFFRNYNGSE